VNPFKENKEMKHLLYLTPLFFLLCCSKRENASTNSNIENNVTENKVAPELQLEVINSESAGPDLKYEIVDGKAIIIRYSGTAESYTIPATIEGALVSEIKRRAFENCTSLKSIIIGENVTSIGSWAFSGCSGLSSIDIPESVTSIGNLAFDKCVALEAINVEENNNNYSSEEGVLYDSGKTKLVQCPIGKVGELNIERGVKYINDFAFRSCEKITRINFNNEVQLIGNGAFQGCTALNQIFLPESINTIGQMAFYKCENLTDIKIPSKVKSIGAQTFSGSGLRSVEFSLGITSISKGAFFDCKGLARVTIPESIKSIGRGAFSRCANLESVTFLGDAPSASSDAFAGTSPTVYYASGTQGWSDQFSGFDVQERPSQP